jgi:hypothetical protein
VRAKAHFRQRYLQVRQKAEQSLQMPHSQPRLPSSTS